MLDVKEDTGNGGEVVKGQHYDGEVPHVRHLLGQSRQLVVMKM